MAKRVLITGLNGFAGQHLKPTLEARGYDVYGLSKAGPGASAEGNLTVDLRDLHQLKAAVAEIRPTHVVHLAGVAFAAHEDVDEIYATNVLGSRHLLTALKVLDRAPEAVVMTSSGNIYGNAAVSAPTETTPPNPANDYAVSKLAMEYVARLFMADLPITIIRPFNYTGVGQSPLFLIPKIVSHFRSGAAEIELGNIEVSRDFSDVRTVCDYIARLLVEPRAIGETFNICSGRATSLKAVIAACEAITGRRMTVRVNPAFVRANEVRVLVGSPDKLKACVGEARDYTLDETLRWMLA